MGEGGLRVHERGRGRERKSTAPSIDYLDLDNPKRERLRNALAKPTGKPPELTKGHGFANY